MKIACLTDRGRSREINEDSLIHQNISQNIDLLIVADGMGGHNAGEVASSIAVESIKGYILERIDSINTGYNPESIISEAIVKANDDIIHESVKDSRYFGMGTTATAALICENFMYIGHVGDSRAYIMKNKILTKLTCDHSLVAELVKNGTITETEALHHPQKNIITRALGTEYTVQVDTEKIEFSIGDTLLLCTDGLTNLISDTDIEKILLEYTDPWTAAQKLVLYANELGGYDNITVIVASAAYPNSEVRE